MHLEWGYRLILLWSDLVMVFLSPEQWPQGFRKMRICELLCGTANYPMLMYSAVCLSFHSHSSLYCLSLKSNTARCSI